jgi:uncharacterized membrane protein YtjA (UPF0391 family)
MHAAGLENTMLYWTCAFIIIAISAAICGFGGVAANFAPLAKILLFFMTALYIITMVMYLANRRQHRPKHI